MAPFDPFDYVAGSGDDTTFGTASATSKGTPMGKVKWGAVNPGIQLHDPATGGEDPPYVEPGEFGGGGPGGYNEGGVGTGTDPGQDPAPWSGWEWDWDPAFEGIGDNPYTGQTGGQTGSMDNYNMIGNQVSGAQTTPGSEWGGYGGSGWGGGMDTDPGQYGSQQGEYTSCLSGGGFWYNGTCNDIGADDPTGWDFGGDTGFSDYMSSYETGSGGINDWFGNMMGGFSESMEENDFAALLSSLLGDMGASGSFDSVASAMMSGSGNTINWESLLSGTGDSGSGGIAGGQLYDWMSGNIMGQAPPEGQDTSLCYTQAGSYLPWC